MPKEPVFQCAWSNCKHPSREILPGEGVKISTKWYHADCAHQKQGILAIRDYYYENINKMVVMSQLMSTIKNIVLVKDIDPDYVLFTLKYAVKNKIPVASPLSMHYLIASLRFQDAWKRYQARKDNPPKTRQELVEEAKRKRQEKAESAGEEQFSFKSAKPKSFADIIGK